MPIEITFPGLATLIEARMMEYRVPGVAFGVCKNGHTRIGTFGVTNIDDPQPITPETVFPIASISKCVTATAVMRLVEQGTVEMKAPVRRYLPEFRVLSEEASRNVTLLHLLTHTPGWEGQLATEDRGDDSLASLVSGLRDLPQVSDPGAVWSYNNTGFGVAGRVIEVATGQSIHDSLRDLAFAPLGLRVALTRTSEVLNQPLAAPHRQSTDGRTETIKRLDLPANVTAGGVAMTLPSLLEFGRLHMGNVSGSNGTNVFRRSSLELMRTPQLRKNSTGDDMGVGWHLRRVGGLLTVAHGGTLDGHCVLLELVPERDLVFAVLTNHRDGWRVIQDVERETLKRYENVSLAANQAIAHRGVNESMAAHAIPLATQPETAEYLGVYERPPLGRVVVKNEGRTLTLSSDLGAGPPGASLVFYGPDVAYATSGTFLGSPFEFIRTCSGAVGWIRINGRVARRI